jgi:hypothetical protein
MKRSINQMAYGTFLSVFCSVLSAAPDAQTTLPVTSQPHGKDVHCFNQAYATSKSNDSASEVGAIADAASGDDLPQNDGRTLQRAQPLGLPPEISRVQRGYVSHFTGSLRNNGLESWTAVDLDRGMVVSVQRRVYDQRVKQSRAVSDPKFNMHGASGRSFARRYVGDGRTEVEAVATEALDKLTIEAFTCVANAAWAAPALEKQFNPTDGTEEAYLKDMRIDDGRTTTYAKRIPAITALDGTLSYTLLVLMPKISW